MRGFHDPLRIRLSSLFLMFGWMSGSVAFLTGHVAGDGREDLGVLEFSMFCDRQFFWMSKPYVLVVSYPGLN